MIAWLMLELWGSALQVVHQTVYRPADLPGLIAERGSRVVGLLTFQTDGSVLEVVTLNALERRAGVGTLLMEAVAAEARQRRCQEIHLTTTNDNLDAIRFYQRRGLRLVALRPGAVDRAREWFGRAGRYANDLGLLAEGGDPATGALRGNYPQAFSHVGLITAAWRLGQCG